MLNADAKYRLKYASPCIQISESESSLDIREQNSICFISRICTHILWQLKNSDVFPSSGARRQASWSTWWLCLQERIPDKMIGGISASITVSLSYASSPCPVFSCVCHLNFCPSNCLLLPYQNPFR